MVAVGSALVVAVVTSVLTYLTTKRLSRRESQISHVSKQIASLYGPLHALSKSGEASFNEFRKEYGQGRLHLLDDPELPASEAELDAWKYWLKHVFMPINRKMVEVLMANTDLIEGDDIPNSLLLFCAHVNGYEVTLARWAEDDFSRLTSVIDHPGDELHVHIAETYRRLKQKQRDLLNG